MGISNVASNLRPGIVTSSTRPTTPYEGQVIYETDTNRVLVYDSAAWVMIADTDQPPGLQLIKTQTVGSAVSSVTVNDAFSSEYDNYKILYTDGAASAQIDLKMTLGSTTAGYYQNVIYTAWNNTVLAVNTNNGASWERAGIAETGTCVLNVELTQPFAAELTTISGPFIGPGSGRVGGYLTGFLNNTTSYTAFTLTTSSGTITGGVIRVYGYRN
jgi:hypothetical protein